MKLPTLRRKKLRRLAIIGLDCAEPSLVFDQFAGELPTLDKLRQHGLYGTLESVIPAITVPAWACMTTGKDPGELGVYGFRNRRDYDYSGFTIADSGMVREPRLWDSLAQHGKRSILLGVPQTYPVQPVNGVLVSSFLTPSLESAYTHPPELKTDIAQWVGEYQFDVQSFRTDDKAWLLEQIYGMTRKRFEVARRLLQREAWDFFMMVEIGVDRIQHGLWKDHDPTHRKHDPKSPYKQAIREYYRYVDNEIASLLALFDEETAVMVVSDHGAQKMDGGIALNEWLLREGYLVLNDPPANGIVRFADLHVDWSRTRAWGEGGYYGRVFLNVQGREPQGIVAAQEYDALRTELAEKLAAIGDEQGQPLGTRCFQPQNIYQTARGIPPDLMVYFGDLSWRSIGSVGHGSIHVFDNDTGPDDANHARNGIFIYHDPQHDFGGRRLDNLQLLQITPTVLKYFDIEQAGHQYIQFNRY